MKQRFSGFSSSSRSDLFLLPPTGARGQAHEAQGELKVLNIMPATILLVDDDDDIRYVTELLLSTHGYFVISCSAADLATVAFRDCPTISLLLTDMQMPGQSGIELARELTALRPSLPVLLVSGRMPTAEAQLELRNRKWSFLDKTADVRTLLSTVGSLLD